MRWGFALAVACGCYSPHPQAGAPCDPARPSCPSGQMCVAEAAGHFCETHAIIDALIADVPADALMIDAPPDAQTVFMYTATVAECVNPALPDPDACRSVKGQDQLVADGSDATTMQPWDAFIRFDLDNAFAGRTLMTAELKLTVTSDNLAPSGSSGSIWQVAMFDKTSLYTAEPAKVGSAAVAPAQSNVVNLQVVTFALPTAVVSAANPLYLGVFTTSMDGVNYWNLAGTSPPVLVVTTK